MCPHCPSIASSRVVLGSCPAAPAVSWAPPSAVTVVLPWSSLPWWACYLPHCLSHSGAGLGGDSCTLSRPKHKLDLSPWGETRSFLSMWSSWRGTVISCGPCHGPCQYLLLCRPREDSDVLHTSGWLCSSAARETRESLLIAVYPHYPKSNAICQSVAIVSSSCIWVHSFFLLLFSRGWSLWTAETWWLAINSL